MRILIISAFFPPRNAMASHRPYSWAKYWSDWGHDVTVVSARYPPSPDDLDVEMNGFELIEIPWMPSLIQKSSRRGGATVHPTHSWNPISLIVSSLGKIVYWLQTRFGIFYAQRYPDVFFFWRLLAKRHLSTRNPWDVVVSTHGPYATHLLAYELKQLGIVKRWVADYRDLWTDNHFYKGLFPFTLYEHYLENKILATVDFTTTVSDPLAQQLLDRYPDLRVQIVSNGFETSELESLPTSSYFPKDGKLRITHTGWIYPGVRDPELLFQALQRCIADSRTERSLPVEIIFVGPESTYVSQLAARYGVEDYVVQLGLKTHRESLHIQRDSGALLLLECNIPTKDGILSGKIFEYIFSKTPIVAIGSPDNAIAELLTNSGTGIHLGSDVAAICEQIRRFIDREKSAWFEPDVEFIAKFSRRKLAGDMLHRIVSMN